MSVLFLIYGITKDDKFHLDPDEAIDLYHYCRKINNDEWDCFKDVRQNVVRKIEAGEVEAYTYRNKEIGAKCEVKTSVNGVRYLKTSPNSDPTDNLSSLPEM